MYIPSFYKIDKDNPNGLWKSKISWNFFKKMVHLKKNLDTRHLPFIQKK